MIEAPHIGLATARDARAIAELSRDTIEHGLQWAWTERRVCHSLADRATNVVVARCGGELAGFALMKYRSDDAHLLLLGVVPARRRQGIATALLAWLEETLRVAGVANVQVEVRAGNAAARALYAKLGFDEVGATRGYYQGVEDTIHLVREITPMSGDNLR